MVMGPQAAVPSSSGSPYASYYPNTEVYSSAIHKRQRGSSLHAHQCVNGQRKTGSVLQLGFIQPYKGTESHSRSNNGDEP